MKIIFIAIAFCFFQSICLYADGKIVTVTLDDSTIVTGELLSVRDSGVIVSTIKGLREFEFSENVGEIKFLAFSNIDYLVINGSNVFLRNTLIGAGIGSLLLITGNELSRSSSSGGSSGFSFKIEKPSILKMAAVGAVLGAIIGGISGLLDSTSDEEVQLTQENLIKILKDSARYEEEEPAVLRKIINRQEKL